MKTTVKLAMVVGIVSAALWFLDDQDTRDEIFDWIDIQVNDVAVRLRDAPVFQREWHIRFSEWNRANDCGRVCAVL